MKRQTGFTLTELMVVVAIVAILMGIGVPSYRYITNSYRISSEVNGLLGDLMFARAEAIKEGWPVTACVSTDGATCTGGNAWAGGWIVFSDPNGNAAVDAGERVLHVQSAFTGAVPDTFNATQNVTSVTFNREGFATAAGAFAATGIVLHDPTAATQWTRCLYITAVGQMSVETVAHSPSGTCT